MTGGWWPEASGWGLVAGGLMAGVLWLVAS